MTFAWVENASIIRRDGELIFVVKDKEHSMDHIETYTTFPDGWTTVHWLMRGGPAGSHRVKSLAIMCDPQIIYQPWPDAVIRRFQR